MIRQRRARARETTASTWQRKPNNNCREEREEGTQPEWRRHRLSLGQYSPFHAAVSIETSSNLSRIRLLHLTYSSSLENSWWRQWLRRGWSPGSCLDSSPQLWSSRPLPRRRPRPSTPSPMCPRGSPGMTGGRRGSSAPSRERRSRASESASRRASGAERGRQGKDPSTPGGLLLYSSLGFEAANIV